MNFKTNDILFSFHYRRIQKHFSSIFQVSKYGMLILKYQILLSFLIIKKFVSGYSMKQMYNTTQKKRSDVPAFFKNSPSNASTRLSQLVEMQREKKQHLSNLQAKIILTNQQLEYISSAIKQEKLREVSSFNISLQELKQQNQSLHKQIQNLQMQLESTLSLNSKMRFIVSEYAERTQTICSKYIDSWDIIEGWVTKEYRSSMEKLVKSILSQHRQLNSWISEQMSQIKEQNRSNQRKSSNNAINKLMVKQLL